MTWLELFLSLCGRLAFGSGSLSRGGGSSLGGLSISLLLGKLLDEELLCTKWMESQGNPNVEN